MMPNHVLDSAELPAQTARLDVTPVVKTAAAVTYACYGHPSANLHLLAIHGLFDDQQTWSPLLRALPRAKLFVVTVDLLGSGASDCPDLNHLPPADRFSPDQHVACLRRLVEHLQMRNLVLLGNSLGGGLALRMLCTPWPERPAIGGLVLEDAAAYPMPLPVTLQQFGGRAGALLLWSPLRRLLLKTGWDARLVDRSIQRAFHSTDQVPADLHSRYLQIFRSPARIRAARETVRNMVPSDLEGMTKEYGEIKLPTLVLWGRQDRILSPLFAQRLAADLHTDRVHLFDDCGHAPHLERSTEMARVLDHWFGEIDA